MTYLLDTNVVSEVRRAQVDSNVATWTRSLNQRDAYLSVVTIRELEAGVRRLERRDPVQGARLRVWLDHEVIPVYSGRILSIDVPVARHAGALHVPDPRPERDALIAATAAIHGLTVATRNVGDFEPMGVRVVNPWDA